MFIDKTIQHWKIKKTGKSAQEIQQIQRASIKHIRSISTELQDLLNQISDIEPSMLSPTASPINPKYKSGPSNNAGEKEQEFIDLSLFKKKIQKAHQKQENPKKASGSVHYSTYMKPIHNVKEKIRFILQQQKKQKQIEEERERIQHEKMKKVSIKNYSTVQTKYNKYDDKKAQKNEAVANRAMERQMNQMQGVTFKPKINNNVEISESFNQRLVNSQNRRMRKEVQIIKDMLKDETHKPKINSHIQTESKIKTIWSQSPRGSRKPSSVYPQVTEFGRILEYSSQLGNKEQANSRIRAALGQVQFMIQKKLFQN